jgi:quinol monooxygenase YgiN
MVIVAVYIKVKEEYIDEFIKATKENAQKSIEEPKIIRFDFCQEEEDPTKFLLIEAYKDVQGTKDHKETQHYKIWRDAVGDMMAEKRYGIKYKEIFPEAVDW